MSEVSRVAQSYPQAAAVVSICGWTVKKVGRTAVAQILRTWHGPYPSGRGDARHARL